MNINTSSLTKAAAIGIGVGIVLGLLGLIPFVGLLFACLGFLVPIGVGALYAMFATQAGDTLTYGPAAVGGGVTAAIAGLVAGIFNLLVSLVVGTSMGAFSQLGDFGDVGGAAAGAAVAGVAGFTGICIGIILGFALGAAGGAIYVAIQGRGSAAA